MTVGHFLATKAAPVTASPCLASHGLAMRVAGRHSYEVGMQIALAFWPTQLCKGNAADPSDPACWRRTPRHYASGPGAQPAGRHAYAIGAERSGDARCHDDAQRASGMAAIPHAGRDPARRGIEPLARIAGQPGPQRARAS